jgi:site-specific recombinase XerD
VQQYAADLELECRDTTVHIRIFGLARAINAMAPDGDWNWLFRMAAHLRLNIHDKKDKQPRLRSSRELHELGMSLMADADEFSTVPWKCATRFRDGLIIALLAARPLRIRNFAGLVIGSHIVETSEGFTLRIPADEVKTHINLEFPLPLDLVRPMRRYLAIHRPVLLGGNEDGHLWITKHGDWMRDGAIYNRVTKLTKKAFGVSVNPHLFRDCAATSMAIEDPEHVHAASKLLGHATIETTTRHYNQATSLSAGRAICNNIQAMRQRRLKDLKPGLEG